MTIPIKRSFLMFVIILLAACGGNPGGGESAQFSLSVSPASADVFQGSRKLVEVTLTRNEGFTDDVEVSLDSPPEGVQASTLIFPNGLKTTLLELTTTSAAKVGSVLKLTLQAVSGTVKTTTVLQLTIKEAVPSSQELIQQALETGIIDYGTSLLYRAYALFGDPNLPEAFVGSGSEEEDNGLFVEAQEADATLTAEVRTKLEPFLVRPTDPKSFFNTQAPSLQTPYLTAQAELVSCADLLPLSWVSQESTFAPVRVWSQCFDSSDSTGPASYVEKTLKIIDKAYAAMTQVMGEPILDTGTADAGGDPNIDIYITSYLFRDSQDILHFGVQSNGVTYTTAPYQGQKSSAFVLIPKWHADTRGFRATLLHEFFHVLQNAHNRKISFQPNPGNPNTWDEFWFVEASATWAAVHFDRTLWANERTTERDLKDRFLNSFQNKRESLHVSRPTLHMYAAYIWPFFVEQETGGPEFMGAIWRGLESATTFEGGNNIIDSVFDFKDNFHHFAVRNLGYYDYFGSIFPERKRYSTLDPLFPKGVSAMPHYRRDNVLTEPAKTLNISLELPSLSADYVRFLVQDPKIRKVKFDFTSGLDRANLDIDALINYKIGGWKLETITADELTLCFDKPAEDANDLWFVFSNHSKNFSDVIAGDFIVQTYALCEDSWAGTSRSVIDNQNPLYEISADVTWIYNEGLSSPEQGRYVYKPEGTVSFTSLLGCTISPSNYAITNENGGELVIDYSTNPPSYRGVGTTLWSATYTCPDFGSFTAGAGGAWFLGEGTLEGDGQTIQGTQTSSGQTFTFKFTRQ